MKTLNKRVTAAMLAWAFFAGFGISEFDNASKDGQILTLAVAPEFQGQGVGTVLLNHIVTRLKRAGVQAVYGWVRSDNQKGKEFFKKQKFTIGDSFNSVELDLR